MIFLSNHLSHGETVVLDAGTPMGFSNSNYQLTFEYASKFERSFPRSSLASFNVFELEQ